MITSDILENAKLSITSYGIHFLTPQWISNRPPRVYDYPFQSLLDSSIVTLTIYLWQFLSNDSLGKHHCSYEIKNQITFRSGITLFTVMSSLSLLNDRNSELGGFSIGYVYITSELTDSQVSFFSPVGTTPLPLWPVHHLWTAGFWNW